MDLKELTSERDRLILSDEMISGAVSNAADRITELSAFDFDASKTLRDALSCLAHEIAWAQIRKCVSDPSLSRDA